jgi:cell division protein ZapA
VDGRRNDENERTAVGSEPDTLSVTIFGSEYKIKGADPDYIQTVAAYVDGKMRELEKRLATGTPTRIAILASLNIADELFRERAERDRLDGELVDRAKAMHRALGESLRDR